MITTTHIQPLARYSNSAGVTSTTQIMIVNTGNAHGLRVVVHTGTLVGTGSATIRVYANTTTNTSSMVLMHQTATLADNTTYEILTSGAAMAQLKPDATYLIVEVTITGTLTVPVMGEVSALPARAVPAALPNGWQRIGG